MSERSANLADVPLHAVPRPTGLGMLGLLSLACAFVALLLSAFFFRYSQQDSMIAMFWGFSSMRPFLIMGAAFLLLAIACAANCYGLFNLCVWSRPLTIVLLAIGTLLLAGIGYVFAPEGALAAFNPYLIAWFLSLAILDFWAIRYLFRKNVKQAFGIPRKTTA